MKIFLDTAVVAEIRAGVALGVVDGVTTNPSLLAKAGRPLEETIREICEIVKGPVSAECVTMEAKDLIEEGRRLAKIDDHVVVKVPMTTEGLKAVHALTADGIRTNVTLIFSALQALLAAKAGATYVSPFIGRLDDIGEEGMQVVADCVTIFDQYGLETQVLAASIRHPIHMLEAARLGAHVATLPLAVLEQMTKHPLTDAGIKKFLADWEKVPKK